MLRGDPRGEVRLIVFAIYLRRLSPDGSSVLPSTSDGQPSQAPPPTRGCARRSPSVVYLNLQLPRRTADMSPCRWWALAPPSHPCLPPRAGGRRLFSSALISRCRLLPFSEVGCPVLPGLSSRFRKGRSPATCRRQTVLLLPAAKLQKKCQTRCGGAATAIVITKSHFTLFTPCLPGGGIEPRKGLHDSHQSTVECSFVCSLVISPNRASISSMVGRVPSTFSG